MAMTALRSLLFFILAPGMVAGVIPLALLRTGPQTQTGFLAHLALPHWLIGVATLLWYSWDFLVKGRGTPAPIDPPKELVVSGLYNYVRNPMYVGVFLVIIGHFLWFGFWNLLVYAVVASIAFHSSVTFYEEPNLKERFGPAYEDYFKKVPRWIRKL